MLQDEQYTSVYPSPMDLHTFKINYSNKAVNCENNMFCLFLVRPEKITVFIGSFYLKLNTSHCTLIRCYTRGRRYVKPLLKTQ